MIARLNHGAELMSDQDLRDFLKKHTEQLVKEVGIETACELTGKSKATLGRYYSDAPDHAERFMPIDAVAQLEAASPFPHVTKALADLQMIVLSYDRNAKAPSSAGVNANVVALSQRFAQLMAEYHLSIEDGAISVNEAKRLLKETVLIQQVLMEMKLHLEAEA